MKVITFYSEAYKPLLHTFIKTFPFEQGVDLEIKYLKSKSDGICFTQEWKYAVLGKLKFIIETLSSLKTNEIVLFTDLDVQFFGNIKDEIKENLSLNEKQIVFMNDNPSLCTGFFACKANNQTIQFFENIDKVAHKFSSEQSACNKTFTKNYINFGYLPSDKFYNISDFYLKLEPRQEDEQLLNTLQKSNISIPKNILVHHANYVTGIENKLKLLELIRNKVNNENTCTNTNLD